MTFNVKKMFKNKLMLTISVAGINFLRLAKNGYCTSLANLRSRGPILIVSLIELCSHVNKKAIPTGLQVIRTARFLFFFYLKIAYF